VRIASGSRGPGEAVELDVKVGDAGTDDGPGRSSGGDANGLPLRSMALNSSS
jgi:hypothetical protein